MTFNRNLYSIVKDSSADLGVNSKIVQIRPTIKAAQCLRLLHKWVQKRFFIILAMFVKSSSKIFYQSEIILQTDINFPT